MTTKEFLIEIAGMGGASGFEGEVSDRIREALLPFCDEVQTDVLGNVIACKKGIGKGKIMFCAHMDEVGMMVTHMESDGKIRLSAVGGVDPRAFLYQKVVIHGEEKVEGFIAMTPPEGESLLSEKAPKMEDLYVDTGLPVEKLENLIRPGHPVTALQEVHSLQGDRLTGKAFDDRAGVAALFACAQNLSRCVHDYTVYFVASVQEEVGCRGAGVATRIIEPDIGVAVDVGFGKNPDFPQVDVELGKGPIIAVGPNCNYNLVKTLKAAASDNGIPCQMMTLPVPRGSDAGPIQIQEEGVYTALVSIPLLYMHTPAEVIAFSDVEKTGKLLSSVVMGLNGQEFIGF